MRLFFSRRALLALIVTFLVGTTEIMAAAPERAAVFVRVPYRETTDLLPLVDAGARVRHLSEGWALVEAALSLRASLPAGSTVIAPVRRNETYAWMAGPVRPSSGVTVLLRSRGAALVAIPISQAERLYRLGSAHDVVPLPVYSRAALTPQARPVRVALSPSRIERARRLSERFDLGRWLETVAQLAENDGTRSRFAFRVRAVHIFDGSAPPDDAADRAADAIARQLEAYGYPVESAPFEHTRFATLSQKEATFTMRNVVATKRGVGPNRDRVFLLTAHYDSIASRSDGWEENWRTMPAPGADDNATGVATVLEAARLLADVNLDFTVKFVLFSGEELGLFGSKSFAKAARAANEDIVGVLNADMIGHDEDGSFDLHVMANASSEWMLAAIQSVGHQVAPDLDLIVRRNSDYVFSDHASFWAEGYSGVAFAEEESFDAPEFPPFYHETADLPGNLNPAYAERVARVVIAATAALARPIGPNEPDETDESDRVRIVRVTAFPNPLVIDAGTPVQVQYQLSAPADVRVDVYDLRGRRVMGRSFAARSVYGRYGLNAPVGWDGRDDAGVPVSAGLYFVRIEARDARGGVARRTIRLLAVPNESFVAPFRTQLTPEP